jgi:hypothetical protein
MSEKETSECTTNFNEEEYLKQLVTFTPEELNEEERWVNSSMSRLQSGAHIPSILRIYNSYVERLAAINKLRSLDKLID